MKKIKAFCKNLNFTHSAEQKFPFEMGCELV